jgi:hypothetical protein
MDSKKFIVKKLIEESENFWKVKIIKPGDQKIEIENFLLTTQLVLVSGLMGGGSKTWFKGLLSAVQKYLYSSSRN